MKLICGPRLPQDLLNVPSGIKVEAYVPDLYKHFAACDLAVVQGGGSTTLELTALRRPFIYFPLEEHFEQQICVAGRLERHKAGIKMMYHRTSPKFLADTILAHIGEEVNWKSVPTDGTQMAAKLIERFLSSKTMG
jgi:UDP:flavonoid glycosyltransferase YjiC (YdhE family)